MAKYDQQYRPINAFETDEKAPISVHQMVNLEKSLNNIAVTHSPRLHFMFPGGLYSVESDTDEQVIASFAPIIIPSIYDRLSVSMTAKCVTGNSTTFKLVSTDKLYTSSAKIEAYSFGRHTSTSFEFTSSSYVIQHDNTQLIKRTNEGMTFLCITAENDTTSDRACILTLDITAQISEAQP